MQIAETNICQSLKESMTTFHISKVICPRVCKHIIITGIMVDVDSPLKPPSFMVKFVIK